MAESCAPFIWCWRTLVGALWWFIVVLRQTLNFYNSRYIVKWVNSYRSRLEDSRSRIPLLKQRRELVYVTGTVDSECCCRFAVSKDFTQCFVAVLVFEEVYVYVYVFHRFIRIM